MFSVVSSECKAWLKRPRWGRRSDGYNKLDDGPMSEEHGGSADALVLAEAWATGDIAKHVPCTWSKPIRNKEPVEQRVAAAKKKLEQRNLALASKLKPAALTEHSTTVAAAPAVECSVGGDDEDLQLDNPDTAAELAKVDV